MKDPLEFTEKWLYSLDVENGTLSNYCRTLYKRQMYGLRVAHFNSRGSWVILESRSALVDTLVRTVWSQARDSRSSTKPGAPALSWVAVGEYGNLELAPHSAVDLVVLAKAELRADEELELRKVLGVLRDIGFEANISTLTNKECLQRLQNDISFSLLFSSARCVAGDETAFQEIYSRFRATQFKNRLVYVYQLTSLLKQIREEYGHTVYLLESHLEKGAGGLFEYRALLNTLRLVTGCATPEKALSDGAIDPVDWKYVLAAHQHLSRARNHLHFTSNMRQDVLSQENADQVAEFFGYRNSRFRKCSELFLRDTLRHRHHIWCTLESYLEQARAQVSKGGDGSRVQYLKMLSPSEETGVEQNPERLMKMFRFSQSQPMILSSSWKNSMRLNLTQWDYRAWNTAPLHDEFRLILKNKGKVGETLRTMRELGVLGRYLPEFGRLEYLVDLDRSHRYSVDEHTLKSIEVLDEVASSSDPALHDYQRVMGQVADPWLIYFGLLLHDSGKGSGPGHEIRGERFAARALQRMNVEAESREKVLLLIREHMLLGHVSQRREIDDPLTVQEVSNTVETADNLNMLLLLTYADLRSVGVSVWSERRDFLLWSLYFKVFDRLMFGDEISEPEHSQAAVIQQKVLELLGSEYDVDTALRHFLMLPARYALYTPVPHIVSHIRLCERLQKRAVVTEWIPHPHAGYTELFLSTHDVPGRFAQIAGSLTAMGISILSAQLNTRDDGIVIDTLEVSDAEGKAIVDKDSWHSVESFLSQVIAGEKALDLLLQSRLGQAALSESSSAIVPRVRIDNDISSQSTVIEVQTEDQLGLGYLIAKALADLGLNIISAKLGTERNYAFDVFYVQTRDGTKITNSAQMTQIMERLRFQLNVA